MSFDFSVRLGDLIPLVGYIIAGAIAVVAMRKDIQYLSRDVIAQGQKIEKLEAVVTMQARHDERLVLMEKLIDDLRRGRGWIKGFAGVNGEYPREE